MQLVESTDIEPTSADWELRLWNQVQLNAIHGSSTVLGDLPIVCCGQAWGWEWVFLVGLLRNRNDEAVAQFINTETWA